ncbi:phosphate ABC transporter substrate-binding protein PstS [Sediminivirga luteola]|uniref:Phosphate-binding protein n=1 Tax=Sediminivirga luteola TaxID=1774748 RepID=A0A8J2TXR7_9MICO|nr:phosphate ABC transporter substrate-binding protein PstS [Sediminivirga luteola]MCI2267199.1 phosphate ABC transporter substrate-binding protein PstS [Sediminivirga luteola]GGA13852.1 phosphate-binding protein PstS [Sediminivirga luteola]
MAPAVAILAASSLALSACGGANNPDTGSEANGAENGGEVSELSGTINAGGASSQETAMTEWTQSFAEIHPNAQVNYAAVGSGGGREGFLSGEYLFAGSDAAMDDDEYEASKEVCGPDGAFHVPAYISPIAVAYNVEGVDTQLNMDAETIARVFAGEITSWDAPEIAEQNDGVDLPSTPITVVHRSDDSGTTENFTEYLHAAAGDVWEWEPDGGWPSDITAESAQQTSGVVSTTSDTDGAITYADASQIGGLQSVAVGVGGEYVPYSADAASNAVASSPRVEGQAPNNMAVELDRDTEEAGAYPIVLAAYSIFCNQYEDEATADLVRAFAEYIVSEEGQQAASEAAGNAPLSADLRAEAEDAISQISAG